MIRIAFRPASGLYTDSDKELCDTNGEAVANPMADINLRLKDFASKSRVAELGEIDASIFISANSLFEYVSNARKWVLDLQ